MNGGDINNVDSEILATSLVLFNNSTLDLFLYTSNVSEINTNELM